MAPTFVKNTLSLALLSVAAALSDNPFTPEAAADINSINTFTAANATAAQFHVYDDSFLPILGDSPTLSLIVNASNSRFPQFHEAAILASTNPPVLFGTSNQYTFDGLISNNTSNKAVVISRVTEDTATQQWSAEIITTEGANVFLLLLI